MQQDIEHSSESFVTLEPQPLRERLERDKSRFRHIMPFSILLFGFWIVLSGKFDIFHLSLGACSAFSVAWGTYHLLHLPPSIGTPGTYPISVIPWARLLAFMPWLMWQITIASVQVARVVIHPAMPVSPRVVRFPTRLPHNLARLTLATSITLTPGTVTLDIVDDDLIIHALTEDSAKSLESPALESPEGEGAMHQRVAALYTPGTTSNQ